MLGPSVVQVIMYECLVGYTPFYAEDPVMTCRKILRWQQVSHQINASGLDRDVGADGARGYPRLALDVFTPLSMCESLVGLLMESDSVLADRPDSGRAVRFPVGLL